jgi:hypothetical protein
MGQSGGSPVDLMAALEASLGPLDPLRISSARGKPKPSTSIERTCRNCGASFLGLAPGKTGLRGVWREPLAWFCSTECAGIELPEAISELSDV